jgi:hypothetical protein
VTWADEVSGKGNGTPYPALRTQRHDILSGLRDTA